MRSTESGLIAGGYDVASFIFLVPVSYYGGTRSKPVFVGIGVLVLGSCIRMTLELYCPLPTASKIRC